MLTDHEAAYRSLLINNGHKNLKLLRNMINEAKSDEEWLTIWWSCKKRKILPENLPYKILEYITTNDTRLMYQLLSDLASTKEPAMILVTNIIQKHLSNVKSEISTIGALTFLANKYNEILHSECKTHLLTLLSSTKNNNILKFAYLALHTCVKLEVITAMEIVNHLKKGLENENQSIVQICCSIIASLSSEAEKFGSAMLLLIPSINTLMKSNICSILKTIIIKIITNLSFIDGRVAVKFEEKLTQMIDKVESRADLVKVSTVECCFSLVEQIPPVSSTLELISKMINRYFNLNDLNVRWCAIELFKYLIVNKYSKFNNYNQLMNQRFNNIRRTIATRNIVINYSLITLMVLMVADGDTIDNINELMMSLLKQHDNQTSDVTIFCLKQAVHYKVADIIHLTFQNRLKLLQQTNNFSPNLVKDLLLIGYKYFNNTNKILNQDINPWLYDIITQIWLKSEQISDLLTMSILLFLTTNLNIKQEILEQSKLDYSRMIETVLSLTSKLIGSKLKFQLTFISNKIRVPDVLKNVECLKCSSLDTKKLIKYRKKFVRKPDIYDLQLADEIELISVYLVTNK